MMTNLLPLAVRSMDEDDAHLMSRRLMRGAAASDVDARARTGAGRHTGDRQRTYVCWTTKTLRRCCSIEERGGTTLTMRRKRCAAHGERPDHRRRRFFAGGRPDRVGADRAAGSVGEQR
jgi:hypothetical protein